jgi:hypothetical protein
VWPKNDDRKNQEYISDIRGGKSDIGSCVEMVSSKMQGMEKDTTG